MWSIIQTHNKKCIQSSIQTHPGKCIQSRVQIHIQFIVETHDQEYNSSFNHYKQDCMYKNNTNITNITNTQTFKRQKHYKYTSIQTSHQNLLITHINL